LNFDKALEYNTYIEDKKCFLVGVKIMKQVTGVLIVFAFLFFVCRVNASTSWTSGHYEINDGDVYSSGVFLYNDCTLDILGGTINELVTLNTMCANLYGGTIKELGVYNNSTMCITNGEVYQLFSFDTSVTNFYGGQIGMVIAKENSIINIYDGSFSSLGAIGDSVINLSAYNVVFDSSAGYLYGYYYSDNSYFTISMNADSYAHVNIIPEPTTFMLLVISGLVLRKKA